MRLFNSERFQSEYRDFKERISKIEKPEVKEDLENLLKRLVGEVRRVDDKHDELMLGAKLSSSVNDDRTSIVETRKKLISKLKDCEQAQLIKSR
jgi:predicted nuclease with TOPRIM domain